MTRLRRPLGVTLVAAASALLSEANVPVSFNLAVDPSGVALQFDVTSENALSAIGVPTFLGASDHEVQSATLASGAHRFVVYSTTGAAISDSGEVSVVFNPSLAVKDGAIAIANVTASNASGAVVTAEPNALPVPAFQTRGHQSVEIGSPFTMDRVAYDLDGAMKSVALMSGTEELDRASSAPFTLAWTPGSSGSFPLTVVAVDNLDQVKAFELGTFRSFAASEITGFAAFASVHYGAASADAAFDADPLRNGISNGLAYLLGINPHAPDLSRLPSAHLSNSETGLELLLRFTRRSDLDGVAWSARAGSNLVDFQEVSSGQISESDAGDGSHEVEIKLPLDPSSEQPSFINLEVSPSS